MNDSVMKIGVTRATAIAAVNALIRHLKLGHFISEYQKIDEHSIRFCKFAGSASVQIEGRTNTDMWVYTASTVVFKEPRGSFFPVEKVYVSIHDPARDCILDEHLHFECTFSEKGISIKKLKQSPYEEDVATES